MPVVPERPLTIRDIAAAAKVHHTTVSRALRNDRQISESVRQHIQALARTMGYRPNPFVSAFTAQVRSYRCAPKGAAILLLQFYHAKSYSLWQNSYFEGIGARAGQLGFRVEHLLFQDLGSSTDRLTSVLRARGIRALIILPAPAGTDLRPLDCRDLALTAIGHSVKSPAIHRASPDFFQNMTLALRTLSDKGYGRIGFAVAQVDLTRFGERWLGAYNTWQNTLPRASRVPVHVNPFLTMPAPIALSHEDFVEWPPEALHAYGSWLENHTPDVVLGSSGAFFRGIQKLGAKLDYAGLGILPDLPHVGGIDQQASAIGGAAVDLVVGQLHRNEYGLPTHPATMLIEGTWVEGQTTRKTGK